MKVDNIETLSAEYNKGTFPLKCVIDPFHAQWNAAELEDKTMGCSPGCSSFKVCFDSSSSTGFQCA